MEDILYLNEYDFSEELFIEFQKSFYKRNHLKRYYFKRFVCAFFFANTFLFFFLAKLEIAVTFLALSICMYYLTFYQPKKTYKLQYSLFTKDNGTKLTRTFYDDYYELQSKSGKTTCKYKDIVDLYTTQNLYVIVNNENDNILLKKDSFSKKDTKDFFEFITTKSL